MVLQSESDSISAPHQDTSQGYADAAAKGRELIKAHPDQVYLHYNVACREARAGPAADAIAALRFAVKAWDGFRVMSTKDSDFDSIRNDPAFQALTAG